MRTLILAALAAGTIATPALAQERPGTGLRIEGMVGWDRADVPAADSDGATYGAGIGYDVPIGNAVAGVEAEISDSSTEECSSNYLVAGDEVCAALGRDLYVGGRIGARVGGNSLVYAKAGYTNARLRTVYEDGTTGTTADFSTGRNLDGFRIGAGAEFGIGPNSYIKTEYRYSNYEQDVERHQVVAGFGFRF